MKFTFLAPGLGVCNVTLWATGRYGFSLPKKIEISTPMGCACTFVYVNRKVRQRAEPSDRALVRIAVAKFLDGELDEPSPIELDTDSLPYRGELIQVRSEKGRTPLRVRPGGLHARAPSGHLESPAPTSES